MAGQRPADADTSALWFNPPDDGESGRRALTRERVVAEALTIIAAEGAQALSMRALAARLGVVPGALYRHVRGKEQLYDLILDAVLGEVDCQTDPAAPWAARVTTLAAGCGRSWKTIRAPQPCSRPATPSAPRHWSSRRHSSRRCSRPGCPAARPPWPSASSTTTPSASPSPTLRRPPSGGCATPPPGNNCTRSSAPCPPAASPPWPRTASTPGTATATSASPPALTPSCADCRRMSACPAPAADPDQLAPGYCRRAFQRRHPTGSDETLVDVAPSPACSRLQGGDHRVVGLLVVRSGVVVRRVIGTGHPAAGQADDESRRAIRVVLAVPAVI